jgi:hypothetical protein
MVAGTNACAGDVKQSESKEEAPAAQAPDSMQVKEINKTSRIALVVVDKNCPDIVQPYKMTDNIASMLNFTLKDTISGAGDKLGDLIKGKPTTTPKGGDISNSARLAAKQLNWLPMNAEVRYGEQSHKTETGLLPRDSKKGKEYYPIADKMLEDILSQVKEKHEYQFKLFILTNDTRNAVARPGGYLYIDKGLLDKPEQHPKAYFALAHEIAHVLQRHETRELQSMIVDSFTAKDELMKVMTTVRSDPSVILGKVKVGKDVFARHHIDQELQADSCGTRLLSRVYPDRQDLANSLNAFLKDLAPPQATPQPVQPQSDAEKLAAAAYDIVSSPVDRHPNTQERTQNLLAMYNEVTSGTAAADSPKPMVPASASDKQTGNARAPENHPSTTTADALKGNEAKPEANESAFSKLKRFVTKPRGQTEQK